MHMITNTFFTVYNRFFPLKIAEASCESISYGWWWRVSDLCTGGFQVEFLEFSFLEGRIFKKPFILLFVYFIYLTRFNAF